MQLYSPYLKRFTQPDTIVPSPANPQGFNRYSYVNNSPINFNDPTGHRGECANDPVCSQLLDEFVEAALDMVSPYGNLRPRFNVFGIKNGYFSGIGLAKVSDAEMESDYGEVVHDKHKKVGLGLRNGTCDNGCEMDQNKPEVAKLAMETRISMRLDKCVENGCTKGDMFMVALLAADERILPSTINSAFKNDKLNSTNELFTLSWEKFLEDNWNKPRDRRKNKQLIRRFSKNIKKSNSQIFSESEWDYIGGLAQ